MNPNATITDEQFKAYLKKVRDMVEGPYTEWQKEIEVTNTFPEKFYQSNIDNDIYRYSLPVEYGGWGLNEKEILQVQEEFSRGPSGMRMHMHYASDLNWRILNDFGQPEIKEKYMPLFQDKTIFTCFALTEQTGGTLVLGTSADYAPYEFMYADDSGTMQYAGIDISAGQYIADELGMELQVENMSFDYLLTSLAKGDFDIVMAAIEVTPERLQSADFSDPYYTDLPAMILVKADAADQYNTLADFAGKSVGAQTATTKEAIVTDQMEGANLVSLSLVTDLVNELVYGKVDAIVVDGAVAEQYAESNPDLVVAAASSELGEAMPYCIAVAKGDPKGLLPGINEAIAKMTSENKMEEFIAAADELSGKAVEVTADAPAA